MFSATGAARTGVRHMKQTSQLKDSPTSRRPMFPALLSGCNFSETSWAQLPPLSHSEVFVPTNTSKWLSANSKQHAPQPQRVKQRGVGRCALGGGRPAHELLRRCTAVCRHGQQLLRARGVDVIRQVNVDPHAPVRACRSQRRLHSNGWQACLKWNNSHRWTACGS